MSKKEEHFQPMVWWLPGSGKRIEIKRSDFALLCFGRDWARTLKVTGEAKVANLIEQAKANGWKRRNARKD